MCDHQAFKPSARGNMNVPFFQGRLHCGIPYHDQSPSPPSWTTPEDWIQSTQFHDDEASLPTSPTDMPFLQPQYIVAEADQHDLALALCVDKGSECIDPTCKEPYCEADLIECTEESCSQPRFPESCHGNNTLCAGNLPPDVLGGAFSLAALRPASSPCTQTYLHQPTDQYLPLCVAIAGGYYNPTHAHPHLSHCAPHVYPNGFSDQCMFDGDHAVADENLSTIGGYPFAHSPQNCHYSGMYYDTESQTVSQLPFQQPIKEELSDPSDSPGLRQSFSFPQRSTPSTTSSFSPPLHRDSMSICDNPQTHTLVQSSCPPGPPTCLWETDSDVICGITFRDNTQLQNHIQQCHTASLRKAHGFTCQWKGCPRRERGGESFAQRSKLDRHIQSHTGYKASICTICGQQFSTTQSLVLHQRTHSGEKPHKCRFPGCDYAAAQASQLTMHNRTKHTKEKPLKCDHPGCIARFAESSNLSKHKKIHLPRAQCVCRICLKPFSRDDQLKRHMKTHARKDAGRGASVSSIVSQIGALNYASKNVEVETR